MNASSHNREKGKIHEYPPFQRIVDWVDPFIGTEAIDLPAPRGITRTWFYLKAQIGNTHPGSCLPFSFVSACPYTGAYPSGYGRYNVNGHGTPPRLYNGKAAFGVTHVQHSGTGYIRSFYNYLLVMPFSDGKPKIPSIDLLQSKPFSLQNEHAVPGYYAANLPEIGVSFQLTVGRQAAAHRYHFAHRRCRSTAASLDKMPGLTVDITNGGLAPLRAQVRPKQALISILKDGSATGTFEHYGVLWFFAIVCPSTDASATIWKGFDSGTENDSNYGLLPIKELPGTKSLQLNTSACRTHRAGIVLRTDSRRFIELYVGLSIASKESALKYARLAASMGFDRLRQDAQKVWEEHLGRVRVEGGDEKTHRIFYTALYHSLIKPVESEATNFLWKDGPSLYTDFATMWDQYKTQLPLVFTLCPERRAPIVRSFLEVERATGIFPTRLLFSSGSVKFDNQSRGLCHVSLWDAYQHMAVSDDMSKKEQTSSVVLSISPMAAIGAEGTDPAAIDEIDWNSVLDAMSGTLDVLAYSVRPGKETQSYSHLLDVGYAAYCTLRLATALGREDARKNALKQFDVWQEAFDLETGMMKEGDYYEAGNIHYSFRLLHEMEKRIALCGGKEAFLEKLDAFFGFGAEPVVQLGDPPWIEARAAGLALGRFDGLNNEVAIETPYAYSYIGHHKKTAEVVAAIMRYQFSDSAGGIPGNDDSGALSSWYVWNAIGLFPVPGQGIFLVGSPVFSKAIIYIGKCEFRIRIIRLSKDAIYLSALRLNGRQLSRTFLRYDEVLCGGELEIDLTEQVGAFVIEELPPSYSQ